MVGCTGDNDFHDLVCANVSCATDPSEIFRDKMWDVNRQFLGIHGRYGENHEAPYQSRCGNLQKGSDEITPIDKAFESQH